MDITQEGDGYSEHLYRIHIPSFSLHLIRHTLP
jgi:hypothetical protein